MREIRIKKLGLVNQFTQEFNQFFENLVNNVEAKPAKEQQNGPLSIVEADKLEVELAFTNMVGRARETYKETLYELSIRFDHFLTQTSVDEDNNPLDPQQLSEVFIEACSKQLQINIKTRLILFKLFEKHVLKQLGHIYSDANEVLIDSGILPTVPKYLNKNADAPAKPEAPSAPAEEIPAAAPPQQPMLQASFSLDMGVLANIMSAARSQNSSLFCAPGTKPEGSHAYYLYSSNPGPVMASPELASLLTKTQPIVDRQLTSGDTPKNVVTDLVHQLLSKQNPDTPQALEQADEDVINLIAMFFDTVLDDSQLPPVVQSLICRLQIPLLKVALRDKSFLTDPEHPAKQLVNVITDAGFGVDESKPLERDPIYRKIADCVQTINRQFKADDNIFDEIYAEIKQQLEKEKRKTNIVENRTNQAEEGKSKIKQARASSQNALYGRLKDARLPETISSFLTNTWLQVLVITHLKHGKDSAEWVEIENVIIDLMWLCQKHEDERSKLRKQRLTPEVLQRIENGLEAAIDNPESRAAKVKAVEEALNDVDAQDVDKESYVELSNDQREALGKADPEQKDWDDMSALERQQTRYEELSNKFYMEARNVPVGVWIDYENENNGRKMRCKLSAKIDAENYIFVNRLGLKSMEKTRRQFAYDMQFKKAVILDNAPLFDRIMQSVISHLRGAA